MLHSSPDAPECKLCAHPYWATRHEHGGPSQDWHELPNAREREWTEEQERQPSIKEEENRQEKARIDPLWTERALQRSLEREKRLQEKACMERKAKSLRRNARRKEASFRAEQQERQCLAPLAANSVDDLKAYELDLESLIEACGEVYV